MNTSTINRTGRLLVNFEHGIILRADDEVEMTHRLANAHPFIYHAIDDSEKGTYFAGPQAFLAAKLRSTGKPTRGLRVIEYRVISDVAGCMTWRKVEDA